MSVYRKIVTDMADREARAKVFGVVIGIVTANKDDSGKYRVKVRFPWLPNGDESGQNSEESHWCRVTSFMAGKDRGMYCLPEVGDEVLVAFEHGDIARPYVIGSLWNGVDTATIDNKGGKNNVRSFKSRSGHVLEFTDDKENKKEKVTIKTNAGARIVLDDSDGGKKIEIYDDQSKNYILIDAQNKKIEISSAEGDLTISAPKGKVSIKAKEMELTTTQNLTLDAGNNCDIKAKQNGTYKTTGGSLELKGGTNFKGEGTTEAEIKGLQVKLTGDMLAQIAATMIKLG